MKQSNQESKQRADLYHNELLRLRACLPPVTVQSKIVKSFSDVGLPVQRTHSI